MNIGNKELHSYILSQTCEQVFRINLHSPEYQEGFIACARFVSELMAELTEKEKNRAELIHAIPMKEN